MSLIHKYKNIAVYARVSKGEEQTVEQQTAALVKRAADEGEWYLVVTEKMSTRKERKIADWLKLQMENCKFDALLVWKLDRLARDQRELLDWRDRVNKYGFALISHTESIDTRTPSGRLMFAIMAAFAEYERDQIGLRTKNKLDHLRTQGIVSGSKKKGHRIYDAAKAEQFYKSLSVRELAKVIGCATATAGKVQKRLRDRDKQYALRNAQAEAMALVRNQLATEAAQLMAEVEAKIKKPCASLSPSGDVDASGQTPVVETQNEPSTSNNPAV